MSLSGAEFALYATEEDAENDRNRLPVNDQTGGADTVTTGTDGMAVFTGLIPGTTYWYRGAYRSRCMRLPPSRWRSRLRTSLPTTPM